MTDPVFFKRPPGLTSVPFRPPSLSDRRRWQAA